MPKTDPSDTGALLLDLYRQSCELPPAEFQDAALLTLRPAVGFDSAMWGTATHRVSGIEMHTIHLHAQPQEMLHGYEAIKHLDVAAAAVAATQSICTLAFDAHHVFAGPRFQPVRDYGRRFRQRHFFISSHLDVNTMFIHWISLFRSRDDQPCTEEERSRLAVLAPHARQALAQNRARHLDRMRVQRVAPEAAGAIADMRGVIYHATDGFAELLRREWDTPPTGRLPAALVQAFGAGALRYNGRACVVDRRTDQALLFLTARPVCAADTLSAREHLVAELVVKGFSHKEIAQRLGRAPATVRNQIQAVYRKLAVGSVAGLVEEMRLAG